MNETSSVVLYGNSYSAETLRGLVVELLDRSGRYVQVAGCNHYGFTTQASDLAGVMYFWYEEGKTWRWRSALAR